MTEFHDWDGIRAELDDGDSDALAAERARTEAWVSTFHLAEDANAFCGRSLDSVASTASMRGLWQRAAVADHVTEEGRS
ncbi:hypothetical protein AB0H83_11160 [Dactylosporangium sp. NPDC050688]|uniref:hypothetical protein n=1 Tax=Dactylosporangium sp. NPDC050688 TaxID=3157217 RepID=UPI0033C9EDDD